MILMIDNYDSFTWNVVQYLWELGAEVVPIGVDPDGFNINRGCGSTHTDYMQAQVMAHGADIGLALDGDADRLIVCDENGALIDGDQIMALIAAHWAEAGHLAGGGVVQIDQRATVRSQLLENRKISTISRR